MDKGSMALSRRKFPAWDRQMSSRIAAPAHTVGAVVFVKRPKGTRAGGVRRIERVNYGPGHKGRGTCQCWPRATQASHQGRCGSCGGFEKQRAGSKDPWADLRLQCGTATGAATIAAGLGVAGLLDVHGAVQSGCARRLAGDRTQDGGRTGASHIAAQARVRGRRMRKNYTLPCNSQEGPGGQASQLPSYPAHSRLSPHCSRLD